MGYVFGNCVQLDHTPTVSEVMSLGTPVGVRYAGSEQVYILGVNCSAIKIAVRHNPASSSANLAEPYVCVAPADVENPDAFVAFGALEWGATGVYTVRCSTIGGKTYNGYHYDAFFQGVQLKADTVPSSMYNEGTTAEYTSGEFYYNVFGTDWTPPEPTDPYEDGGYSGEGGGEGDFTDPSDPMPVPGLPTASVYDTGFMTIFTPTKQELYNLAGYMWSSLFSVESFKKLFADPMDAILGMSIVPVTVPNDGQRNVVVGNISTGVNMTVAKQQYIELDCGTINVTEYWGCYLDYEPYVTADIVLPYIGTHPISADEIVGHMVGVKYHIDILSGACVAFVTRDTDVLYTFSGQCAISVPICSNDWTNVLNGALTVAASIGTMVATGGMAAPIAVGGIASAAVNQSKPSIERSGAVNGASGILGMQTPYIILTRPKQALPQGQNRQIGYPSYMTAMLSTLTGYTEIDSIHLEGIPATSDELSEIEDLLKAGVIL